MPPYPSQNGRRPVGKDAEMVTVSVTGVGAPTHGTRRHGTTNGNPTGRMPGPMGGEPEIEGKRERRRNGTETKRKGTLDRCCDLWYNILGAP